MHLDFENKSDRLIVHLVGELDHHSAEEVRVKIDDRLDRNNNINKLIMDFSEVTFMDSSGVGVVIGRYKKLSSRNGIVSVTNVRESINRVFELSGMYKIVKLYSTVDDAVSSL